MIGANSTILGSRGRFELPRVLRPVGSRIVDEAWVAWVDPGTMIQPTSARGLAWIDPLEVPGLLVPRGLGSDSRGTGLATGLPTTRQRVDREPIEQEPRASIRVMRGWIPPAIGSHWTAVLS